MLLKLLLFALWMILIPFLTGYFSSEYKKEDPDVFRAYFNGLFFELALFEVLSVPMVFLKASLHTLTYTWVLLSVLIALVLIFRARGVSSLTGKIKSTVSHPVSFLKSRVTPYLVLALILILLQAAVAALGEHIDDDDAFFVASAETSVTTDTLMEYDPYTGAEYTSGPPARYVFSAWRLLYAALSLLTGMHSALIAHLVLPGLIILFAYLIYALIAQELFSKEEREKRDLFLFIVALVLMTGGYAAHSLGTMLITRGWQGKVIMGTIIQPALFYACHKSMGDKEGRSAWILQFLIVTASCMFSSISVILSTIPVLAYALYYAVKKRNWRYLPYSVLTCASALACGVGYLILR